MSFREGKDEDDDGKEKDNNNDSLNMQESVSSLAPRDGGPGVRLEQPWKAGRTVRLGPASHWANRFISVGEGGGQWGLTPGATWLRHLQARSPRLEAGQ